MDEVDALCPSRDDTGVSGEVASRLVATLLGELDGVSGAADQVVRTFACVRTRVCG